MILRKPYALFIKLFRPIHFIFAICTGFLIYEQNKILSFLNNYLYSDILINTQGIKQELFSIYLYILPIIFIILSLLLFGIMFRKNKPYKFYFISLFIFLAVLIINIYTSNFLSVLENTTVSIKSVKLIHDFILITILIESLFLIIYIIRGFGINFKKFDFDSDIVKFDIDEKDKEEFELDLKIDFNETKRKRKERLRNFKYFYLENKFIINIVSLLSFVVIIFLTIFAIIRHNNYNKEGKEYNLNDFDILVEETNLINTNYDGNKITDNYLVVVKSKLKSYYSSKSLYLKDFNLKVGTARITATKKYDKYLVDIGSSYNNDILTNEYKTYIFVYEIPKKFITSDIYFSYNNLGYNFDIKLIPKDLRYGNNTIEVEKGNKIDFKDSLGDISFNINDYEIKNFYKINYNYCIKNDNCVNSLEYLTPSIDEDFNKTILRLDIAYENNTKLDLTNFYYLLNEFGDIYYKIGNEWIIQDSNFEQIVSKKGSNYYTYIGVNSDIENSENIKFVFNIRGLKYEYILK